MRDISFRDVLHALDQHPPTTPPNPGSPAPQCARSPSQCAPSSPPPPLEETSPPSPSCVAMALLAAASLQVSGPPRPVAIRPKTDRPRGEPPLSLLSSSTSSSTASSTVPALLSVFDPTAQLLFEPILSAMKMPPMRLAPRPLAPRPNSAGDPSPSSSSSPLGLLKEGDSDSSADAFSRRSKRRKTRVCRTSGCDKYVVDHGLCIAHGGGKRCSMEGCNCRAQNRGLCWKHGGFTICTVTGCTKRAKSRGICWSHGGGTKCKTDGCDKIAVSHGRCWAHGGGKRCVVEGCKKPASERMNNCCTDHFDPPSTRAE